MRIPITAGLCLALAVSASVLAQVREGTIRREGTRVTGRRVSEILGAPVALRGGEPLGKVADLVLGTDGRVEYYIVRQGDDLLAVPWGAVERGTGDLRVLTTVTRDRLKGVLFREASWPDFTSETWRTSAAAVWGSTSMPRLEAVRRPPAPPAATAPGRPGTTDPRSRSDPLLPGGTGDTRDRKPPAKDKDR
ncbi:MAG: PRC-barrel domain-containing protein [Gemmataceae bacterium]